MMTPEIRQRIVAICAGDIMAGFPHIREEILHNLDNGRTARTLLWAAGMLRNENCFAHAADLRQLAEEISPAARATPPHYEIRISSTNDILATVSNPDNYTCSNWETMLEDAQDADGGPMCPVNYGGQR